MAKAKNERNKQFITAWKQEGLSDKQLQDRFGLSEGGVKGLKARLRAKDSALYTGKVKKKIRESSSKVTSTSTSTSAGTSTSTKRMTFWLKQETIDRIKTKATREGKTASQIVREIFSKHL